MYTKVDKRTAACLRLIGEPKKQGAFYDKIFNWISLGIIVAALAAVAYLVFFR